VYLATTDDRVARSKTGKALDTKFRTTRRASTDPMAAGVNGKVIVGGSGGEFGVRGTSWPTTPTLARNCGDLHHPCEGEPGHDTWQGDDWSPAAAPPG